MTLQKAIEILNKHKCEGRSDWIHCDEAAKAPHRIQRHAPIADSAAVSPTAPNLVVPALFAIAAAERFMADEQST